MTLLFLLNSFILDVLDRSSLGAHGPSIQSFGKDIHNNNLTAILDLLSQDEWDVFLDEKSRKVVEQMLVNSAKKHVKGQVFFISPQQSMYNTKSFDDAEMQLDLETENVKVIKIEK